MLTLEVDKIYLQQVDWDFYTKPEEESEIERIPESRQSSLLSRVLGENFIVPSLYNLAFGYYTNVLLGIYKYQIRTSAEQPCICLAVPVISNE